MPAINTTLVINNLTHLSYYCNYSLFQSSFHIWFVGHIGVCTAEMSRNLLPYIFYHMFILFFVFYVYIIMLVLSVLVLWLLPVQYHTSILVKRLELFWVKRYIKFSLLLLLSLL